MDDDAADGGTERPRLYRRELLQGRLGKLFRRATPKRISLRYPKTLADVDGDADGGAAISDKQANRRTSASKAPRTINGIVIEPVAPTDLNAPVAPPPLPIFRPPGAIPEDRFMAGCTRCSECINACPYQAITKAPLRLGSVYGTPIIQAESQACRMCKDFPCITACPEGVLKHDASKTIGTARITPQLCLAHQPSGADTSDTCTVCSEQCPIEDAIHFDGSKPLINESCCTGCGVCRQVCPAPENAILLMPIYHRPG